MEKINFSDFMASLKTAYYGFTLNAIECGRVCIDKKTFKFKVIYDYQHTIDQPITASDYYKELRKDNYVYDLKKFLKLKFWYLNWKEAYSVETSVRAIKGLYNGVNKEIRNNLSMHLFEFGLVGAIKEYLYFVPTLRMKKGDKDSMVVLYNRYKDVITMGDDIKIWLGNILLPQSYYGSMFSYKDIKTEKYYDEVVCNL